jgi:hypothetical protein
MSANGIVYPHQQTVACSKLKLAYTGIGACRELDILREWPRFQRPAVLLSQTRRFIGRTHLMYEAAVSEDKGSHGVSEISIKVVGERCFPPLVIPKMDIV